VVIFEDSSESLINKHVAGSHTRLPKTCYVDIVLV